MTSDEDIIEQEFRQLKKEVEDGILDHQEIVAVLRGLNEHAAYRRNNDGR